MIGGSPGGRLGGDSGQGGDLGVFGRSGGEKGGGGTSGGGGGSGDGGGDGGRTMAWLGHVPLNWRPGTQHGKYHTLVFVPEEVKDM